MLVSGFRFRVPSRGKENGFASLAELFRDPIGKKQPHGIASRSRTRDRSYSPDSGRVYCFLPGGIAPVARSGKDCVSVAGVVPLSSNPVQSPAHSLVPLTVPTSLQPAGSFGLT